MEAESEFGLHNRDMPLNSRPSPMESETEKPAVRIDAHNKHEPRPKNFVLYEEFSHKNIAETTKVHRTKFEQSSAEKKNSLEVEADDEVQAFRIWLEETKHFQPIEAHYYSISLKSLLVGLPTGVSLARLFNTILDRLPTPDDF